VDLLMSYLKSEARLGVRQAILGELGYLAEAAPHEWSVENVETLVEFARLSRHNTATTTTALSVLASLTSAQALPSIILTPESTIISLCRECVYDGNIGVACRAIQLFTNIALYMNEEQKVDIVCEEAHCAALSLLQSVICASQPDETNRNETNSVPNGLRTCLVCAVLLAKTSPSIMCDLASTLTESLADNMLSVCGCQLVCEALASLGGSHGEILNPHLPTILKFIQKFTLEAPLDSHKTKLLVTLVTLVMQVFHGHVWSSQAEAAVIAASKCVNQWAAFCIARQASRYGHHSLAGGIYIVLSWRVCSDQQHFWVSSLAELSRGEASPALSGDRADNLTAANMHLHRALSSLK
ncbi:hypothetical protein SK128_022949, partial [Halocaridina rubra]